MPRTKNTTRQRKRSESLGEEDSKSQFQIVSQPQSQLGRPAKRARTQNEKDEPSTDPQPTNKILPETINFPPRLSGTLRIAAWNICGLVPSLKKGFRSYVEAEDPDILILTETKVNDVPLDPELILRFPHSYWSISSTKTYSGTAILSRHEPLSVNKTLPGHPDPTSVKGRIITLEFEHCFLIGTYVVNAGQGLKTLDAKKVWNTHFTAYMRSLDEKKPVIWTGDLNVAPTEKDLTHAKRNWNKTPGYTEAETTAFKCILDPTLDPSCKSDTPAAEGSPVGEGNVPNTLAPKKFVDIWRNMHPHTRHFTYFSFRFNCREKGIGWRLDMFVVSERIVDRVKMCEIRSDIYGASDHCPIVMEIETAVL